MHKFRGGGGEGGAPLPEPPFPLELLTVAVVVVDAVAAGVALVEAVAAVDAVDAVVEVPAATEAAAEAVLLPAFETAGELDDALGGDLSALFTARGSSIRDSEMNFGNAPTAGPGELGWLLPACEGGVA